MGFLEHMLNVYKWKCEWKAKQMDNPVYGSNIV